MYGADRTTDGRRKTDCQRGKEWTMSRWISNLTLALGVAGLLTLPGVSYAGEMIKEHDCVGNDLELDFVRQDAGCTPEAQTIFQQLVT